MLKFEDIEGNWSFPIKHFFVSLIDCLNLAERGIFDLKIIVLIVNYEILSVQSLHSVKNI